MACRQEAEGRCRPFPKILTIPACQSLAIPACRFLDVCGGHGPSCAPEHPLLASNHVPPDGRSLPMGYPVTAKVRPSLCNTLASDSTISGW
ncbi:hypothetical protein GCM10022207_54490 [Streptomyces lannensis]|uniref:Uncharacterized protein n=1 Tax=Streptomyces lannensis TaxID=766498 RepID=A0ABP7KN29_9ACTN